MPENPRINLRAPDPATDILLCRVPRLPYPPGISKEDDTCLFAHPVHSSTTIFYLRYLDEFAGQPVICPLDPDDAAAFIIGLAGFELTGIPAPEQNCIREYFPRWFGRRNACEGDPAERSPDTPVTGNETRPDVPPGSSPLTGSSVGRSYPSPSPDPATDTILYRSLRHNLSDGKRQEYGVDLFAVHEADGIPVLYFRHWRWSDTGPGICQITSREDAALFIREQFTKPGLFSGWNHRGLHEFLPEVYGKER
ncbi:hypothetical protein [Methanoregula sp.]|uniref:hypothetical protein n=1 Tax=Methanoregula sp. TaxID=2052170 RepID=UPI00356A29E6